MIGASGLFEAFRSFEALCFCAQLHRNAKAIGGTARSVCEDDRKKISGQRAIAPEEFSPDARSSEELLARRLLCEFIGRAYEKRFVMSGTGAFSCRLSDGSVLITPENKDRLTLSVEDLVLVKNGKTEAGKSPSATLRRHLAIYANDPDIGSIIESTPSCSMAFAVTEKIPDLRLLPETYITLKTVRKYPLTVDDATVARALTVKSPVLIVENDCVIAVGTSLLRAFDRLEMMENSAKIFADALAFGEVPLGIGDEAFGELERAFNL